jgi:hypothetical protein
LNIDKFRENSILNLHEYTVLFPPIISREIHIEESYKWKKYCKNNNSSEINIMNIKKKSIISKVMQ